MTHPVYLLDANVLLALFMPEHEAYPRASRWFKGLRRPSWATCAFTQAAFVRLASHPSVLPSALTTGEAKALLADNLQLPGHIFWPVDISFNEAIAPFSLKVTGHRQVTDAYLLGIAMNKGGKLATMDRAISALLPGSEASIWITEV